VTRIDHNTNGWRDPNVTSGAPSYDKQITRKHEPEDSHYHRRKPRLGPKYTQTKKKRIRRWPKSSRLAEGLLPSNLTPATSVHLTFLWIVCGGRSAGWDRAFRLSHKQCRYRPPQRIEKTTEAELNALYNVHFKGVFFLTQKLLPLINDGGRIVNISFGSPASSCLTAPLMVR